MRLRINAGRGAVVSTQYVVYKHWVHFTFTFNKYKLLRTIPEMELQCAEEQYITVRPRVRVSVTSRLFSLSS